MVRTKTSRPTPKPPGDTALNPTSGWGRGWVDEWSKYEGEFLDGQPHGYGRAKFVTPRKWPQGDRAGYEGQWRNGQPHGHGVGYGQKVCGFKQNGGPATMIVKRYEGEWRCGQPCGRGVEYLAWHTSYASVYDLHLDSTWPRKEYMGEWLDGARYGRGVSFDPTGAVKFDGEWSAGKAHGLGVDYSCGKETGGGQDAAAATRDVAQQGRWEQGELQASEPVDLRQQLPPIPECADAVRAAAAAAEAVQSLVSTQDGSAIGGGAAADAVPEPVPILTWLETEDHARSDDDAAARTGVEAVSSSSDQSRPAPDAEETDAKNLASKKPRKEGKEGPREDPREIL